jgi:peptide chain release factor subunit 1
MAATVSWQVLRDLAGFRAEKGCAISLYLNLDPSVSPTAGDAATRVNALIDRAEKRFGANRSELTHDQKVALRTDLDRVRRYFELDFQRDGAHGLAVFAAALDNFWRPIPLTAAVQDEVKIDETFYLTPLVPLVGRGEGAFVAVVGRERGDLYRLRGGRLTEVADHTEEAPGKHDQGGWSQARYQRHIENIVQSHLRGVADELDRQIRRRGGKIVVVTSEETRGEFADLLSAEVRGAVIGWAHAEAHATPAELLGLVRPILEKWRDREESEALERWQEEAGRNGRAAAGWAETLEAASDGRVELLLYQYGKDRPAWCCPACGRLALEAGKCPLDGTELEPRSDGLDLAIHQTLAHGGTAWAVLSRQDLEPVEGIAALLRY